MQIYKIARPVAWQQYRLLEVAAFAVLLGAVAFQSNSARAAEQLTLTATGKDGTFAGKPSCRMTFQVNNPTKDEVTLFSTELRAVDAASGKALETVSLPVIGIAGDKLAPQSVSKPWPLNVRETSCAQVAVRFKKLLCVAGGRPCAPIAVTQKGVASIVVPVQ